MSKREIGPHRGTPQERACASDADVVFLGGAAGGGKSWALLFKPYRQLRDDPAARVTLFRRTYPQLSAPGGLIDEAKQMYPQLGADRREGGRRWDFPAGGHLIFSHMQHPDDVRNWDGAQMTFVGFDQLEQFERGQFIDLIGRARSTESRSEPQVFATFNPTGPNHWLFDLVRWWLQPNPSGAGYVPDSERAGAKRHFFRDGDEFVWVDEDETDEDGQPPTSIAFFPSTVYDNPAILDNDPGYLARLNSLGRVEKARKKEGVWGVSADDGIFRDHEIVVMTPDELKTYEPDTVQVVRCWDLAESEEGAGGSATASGKLGLWWEPRWVCQNDGHYESRHREICDEAHHHDECLYESTERVESCPQCGCRWVDKATKPVFAAYHATARRLTGDAKEAYMQRTAEADGTAIPQAIEQEPGSSGKTVSDYYARTAFADHMTHIVRPTGNKVSRAQVLVSAAEAGRLIVESGPSASTILEAFEGFPVSGEDVVDAFSGAASLLLSGQVRSRRRRKMVKSAASYGMTGGPFGYG